MPQQKPKAARCHENLHRGQSGIAAARADCQSGRMASVVFFRAANVGGHQVFQPCQLVRALSALEVVNIGAAGTFVVRATISTARLRQEILRHLPFTPELMICPARDVAALLAAAPFEGVPTGKDVKGFVTILQRTPKPAPQLPLVFPETGPWEIQFCRLIGPFLLSVRRPGKKDLYPNAVAEKFFGVSATTRNWNTIEHIGRVLAA